jgi:putative heme-binding domain-containing protein
MCMMHRVALLAFICFASFLDAQTTLPAGNDDVRKLMETYGGRGTLRDDTPPSSPQDALKKFKMRDGFAIDLIAAEPDVAQPLYMSFDSRGRLWVTQYIQYQFPAGLKIMSYDQHLRAVFDKVPEPPPRGVKGADKITVFEDTDGDGVFDKHKDVITGLNIATAAIKGAGGIWVMNTPYLLFYPDANDDDIPDGDPEVCLSGFGLQDTHSVANSIQFGPDGWLYGANGSTTKGNVSSKVTKNVKFEGQHIWRYHPKSRVFELYAEGGGNTFSTEIDAQGRFFSGTNGSARGMHYDQGMSGVKGFGKHGPPTNPYGFGYFDHMETKSDGKRFSQAFCIYDGGLMADKLGRRFVAANSLQNMCYVSRRIADTSTFRAEDEAPLLTSSDRWFRPVDIKVGPDGGIYLADWYDTRLSHVRPIDDWSKVDGRIYRVRPADAKVGLKPFDLHKADVGELVKNLGSADKWFRRQAALELYWRGEKSSLAGLEKLVRDAANPHALDALFALHLLGGLSDHLAVDLLKQADPYIRRWIIRCAGDKGEVSTLLASSLKELARTEEHPEVRTQLLCSAKRLPAEAALPIVRVMMEREADIADKRIPLLLWWALEAKAETDRDALLALFADEPIWKLQLGRKFGAFDLAKRWAMAGGKENFEACTKLLSLAKRDEDRTLVMEGIAAAFEGGKLPPLPLALADAMNAYLKSQLDTDLALAVKTGNAEAVKRALAIVKDDKASSEKRASLVQALADASNKDAVPVIMGILSKSTNTGLKKAVLSSATKFEDHQLAKAVLDGYEGRYAGDPSLRDAAHRMLASRKEWARMFLSEVDKWHIKAADIAPDIVRQLALYKDAEIDALIAKHWKTAEKKLSNAQKITEAQRIKGVLAGGAGDAEKGHALFMQRCAICHTLFNEGGKIGPDLTGYERSNPDFWLTATIDPSIEIREGFGAYVVKLKDGQFLMGILDKQDASGISLKDLAGQRHSARTDNIESLEASPISLMPEGMLAGVSDGDLRDLFAWLMKP